MSVTGKRMRKTPHGWMLAEVLLLAAAGLLAVHSHQTAAVPPEEPAQEEPPVMVIPAEPALPEDPVEEEPAPEEPWRPVAESAPVDDSYFDDVAFVGDSRTDGFRLYSGLNRGTYFCVTGETVASATELENWKGENGKKVSLAAVSYTHLNEGEKLFIPVHCVPPIPLPWRHRPPGGWLC